jgi:GlpG protein
MSFSFTALQLDITEDLLPLSAVLHQRGVNHRIYEKGGQQVLMVARQEQVEAVQALYQAWRAGEFRIERVASPEGQSVWASSRTRAYLAAHIAPITIHLVALSVVGFALVFLGSPKGLLGLMTFSPNTLTGEGIAYRGMDGQYWRFITPVFLHFGWLHIAFNCLWLWELGARIEKTLGSVNMFFLFLSIALVSNSAQFAFGGAGLFGGMSGVVYGLLGFSWVGSHVQPVWQFSPPRPVLLMMLGWLVLCLLGVVEALAFGAIANAAHLGGLLMGMLLGAAFGLLSRFSHDKR